MPLPGPQTAAYDCEADELFYGGAQGGGKCLTPDHEVLVNGRGWVPIASVVAGDEVLSWREGDMIWSKVQATHSYRFVGKLRTYKGRWSFRATPNHKWRVRWETETQASSNRGRSCKWRWADATELRPQMKVPCGGKEVFAGGMSYSAEELELWGWWLAEGSGFTPGGMARFSQVKTHGRNRLVNLANVLGLHCTMPAREIRIRWKPPENCGVDCYDKFIPRSLFSELERGRLLAGLLGGDGYMRRKGWEYSSSSWELANGVHELATLLGLRATINTKKVQSGNPHWIVRAYPRQEWSISPETGALGWESYDGPVHCLTVEEGVFCTRHGGGVHVTGNSDLLLGLAVTRHHSSVIFRREFPLHRALIERSREIFNSAAIDRLHDRYNESLHRWAFTDGKMIEFGAMEHEADKENWRGRPHDFYGFDECTQITESQFRFVTAWCRSHRTGQRCRIIATGNPPTSVEGEWVIRYWAPWLDETYPRPAEPGEIRWFARLNDRDVECHNGDPFEFKHKGGMIETVRPRSRSFIPARLEDNPILEARGYRAVLQALPEPLRSQALYGDWKIGLTDDAWQVVPTAWYRAAVERWKKAGGPMPGQRMTAMGVDVAHGGQAQTVIVPRYGNWFAPPIKFPGAETKDGPAVAQIVVKHHEAGADINIDAQGYGASACEFLQSYTWLHATVRPINEESKSTLYDKTGRFKFASLRSAMFWKLREALDPENGDNLMLPPDREMMADICAPRYSIRASGILVEPKDDIKERTGRTLDVGDALIYCHWISVGGMVPSPDLMEAADKAIAKTPHNRWWETMPAQVNGTRRGMYGRGGEEE